MYNQDYVDETLKNIFSDPTITNIICSIYDQHLTLHAIASLLNLDSEIVNIHLKKLVDLNLVKKVEKEGQVYFIITNSKVCDSILMLKDAIQRIS
ncbi:MAG TPA: hypothetical protein DHV28_09415 [Ignavibacteriales bacterium]|nr:MAG: hypothetical protein A2057_01580 [Ignavibacteria bacterium GWA2_35_9]OGU33630.1 MAG: hypothetical protein A2068_11420 [Ignavibacteria bacterium GWB2_35_6b]OGU52583.1 MAG: hypothetical protein A2080_04750 [Ignavibacteria bacterium GWC2_36_12]HCY76125.1 hypothetical protein [Ignavibacteriales bacterium]